MRRQSLLNGLLAVAVVLSTAPLPARADVVSAPSAASPRVAAVDLRAPAPVIDPAWRIADVWVQIGADGSVAGVRLPAGQDRETGPMLAALAQTLRFRPAEAKGRPVASGAPLRMFLADEIDTDGDGKVAVRVARAELSYGRLLKYVPPRYPPSAGREGIGGFVSVQFDVDAEGRVIDDSVVPVSSEFHQDGSRYAGPIANTLQGAAVASVRQWEFQVPRIGDEPMRLRGTSTVRFGVVGDGSAVPPTAERAVNEALQLVDTQLQMARLLVPTAPAR